MASAFTHIKVDHLNENQNNCDLSYFFKPSFTSTQHTPLQNKSGTRRRKRSSVRNYENDISLYWRKTKRNRMDNCNFDNSDSFQDSLSDKMNNAEPPCHIVWADDASSEKITVINFKPRPVSTNEPEASAKDSNLSSEQIKQMDIVLDNLINLLKLDQTKVKSQSQNSDQDLVNHENQDSSSVLTQEMINLSPNETHTQSMNDQNSFKSSQTVALEFDFEEELNDEDDWLSQITDDFLLGCVKIGSDGIVSEGLLKAKENIPVPFEVTSSNKNKFTSLNRPLPKSNSQGLIENTKQSFSRSSCSVSKLSERKLLKSKSDTNRSKVFTEITNTIKPIFNNEPNKVVTKTEPNPETNHANKKSGPDSLSSAVKDEDTFVFDDDGDEIIKNMDIDELISQETVKINETLRNESMDLETFIKSQDIQIDMDESISWDDECDIICSNI